MKNVYQVLREKELELQRLRDEVAALHIVIPLLADAGEWLERGGVLAPVPTNDSELEKDVVQKPA
jgi:hypothetical protein